MTNGDNIRAMTDEELAGIIGFNECKDTAHDYECPAYSKAPECGGACRKQFLKWLKQKASERTYERRCESCIHFVPYPESEEFDICKIQDSCYEIYRDLPYDKCTGFCAKERDLK